MDIQKKKKQRNEELLVIYVTDEYPQYRNMLFSHLIFKLLSDLRESNKN